MVNYILQKGYYLKVILIIMIFLQEKSVINKEIYLLALLKKGKLMEKVYIFIQI